MRELLAALLLVASPALAQSNGWAEMANGWGEIQNGTVPYTSPSTATLDLRPGSLIANNLTATALPTPGAITVTPVLTQVGTINVVAGANLADGDYFTINYGSGTIPIEFEATPGDGTTGGRIPFVFAPGDTAGTIRDGLIAILGAAAPTKVTAAIGGAAAITLTRIPAGQDGVSITENVTNAGFTVVTWGVTAATTYTYRIVWRLPDGTTTEAGAASSTAAGHATLSTANRNDLSWTAGPTGSVTDVYKTVGGTTGRIATGITATSLSDTGLAGGGETAPTTNGTGVVRGDRISVGADWTIFTNTSQLSFYMGNRAGGTTPADASLGNTVGGYHSGYSLTSGGDNTLWGSYCGPLITTGLYNTFIGADAGGRITTQNNATGIGKTALWGITGEGNTGVGSNALYSPTQAAGTGNTAVGNQAGYSVVGNRNVFLGAYAGYYHTGGAKLFIDAPSTNAAGASNFPLVGGDFDANTVGLRGDTTIISPTTLAGETLANGALTSGTSWNVTGDYALAGNAATYTHSAGSGTLFQEGADHLIAGSTTRAEWYVLTYVASGATGDAAAAMQTWITVATPLSVATGTHTVYLLVPAGSARFTINATSTSGGFTLDTLSLKRVTGGDLYVNRDITVARVVKGSAGKAITDGSATAFATFTIADGASYSGEVFYSVKAAKATARQVLHGRVSFAATREGSTYTAVVGTTHEALEQTLAAAAGTLTGGVTIACTGGVCTFSATFDTSQATPDSFAINYRIDSPDAGLTVTGL